MIKKNGLKTIKNFMLWFFIWTKRLLCRPFFLFTLFLIPVTALWIQNTDLSKDAVLRIALYTEGKNPDSLSKTMTEELLNLSNQTVQFYACSSKKMLEQDIHDKKAISGYILPADLKKETMAFADTKKPFIQAIQYEEEMSNKIVNEILLGKIYQTHAYQILENYILSKDNNADRTFLKKQFANYRRHELLFQFEYANGKENKFLSGDAAGILLMPLRGIISVIVLLSCMAGTFLWYEDETHGFSIISGRKKRRLCSACSLLVPGLYAGIAGTVSILFTDISESVLSEMTAMLCFLGACLSLVFFLRTILPSKELFLSAIPVFTIGSLLLCPVFINLSIYSPVLRFLRYLFPSHYYLRSLYNPADLRNMFLYGLIFFLTGKLLRNLRKINYLLSSKNACI